MMTIYFGKSASGKDTLMKARVSEGLKPCISMTTRPMRDGETDGVDYYFVSKERFFKEIDRGGLVEYRSYDTLVNGVPDTWYYGTPVVDIKDDYVAVTDVGGLKALIRYYGAENITPVYVTADDDTRRSRAEKRGSFDETEWNRRLKDDVIRFSDSELKSVEELLGRPFERFDNNGSKPLFM